VARAAALTGADQHAFDALLKLRESGEFHGEITPVYGAYLKALEKVLHALDHHFPKREWQRVKKTGSCNRRMRGGYERRSDCFGCYRGHRVDFWQLIYRPQKSDGHQERSGECRLGAGGRSAAAARGLDPQPRGDGEGIREARTSCLR